MIFRVADAESLTGILEQNGIETVQGEDLGLH